MIIRRPILEYDSEIPVATVSKSYQLIQHRQVIKAIVDALAQVGINHNEVKAELMMSQYGERVGLHIQFPDAYSFDPGDGHELALQLCVYNSVDRSSRFRAVLGWFRLVCSNGMIVGSAQSDYKRCHNQTLVLSDFNGLLTQGIELAVTDQIHLEKWCKTGFHKEQLTYWIDNYVAKKWGVIAATRAYHIATSGMDVHVKPFSKQVLPSQKTVTFGNSVPGSSNPAQSIYDVYQVLSWLAGKRNDIDGQLNWQREIPALMASLMEYS